MRRALLRLEKTEQTYIWTDGRTDGRQTITLRFSLDEVGVRIHETVNEQTNRRCRKALSRLRRLSLLLLTVSCSLYGRFNAAAHKHTSRRIINNSSCAAL